MARLTEEDKLKINEIYYEVKTYAETARRTGFSASTVKKYIIPNFASRAVNIGKTFILNDLPEFNYDSFLNINNFAELCIYDEEEFEKIQELWKELII